MQFLTTNLKQQQQNTQKETNKNKKAKTTTKHWKYMGYLIHGCCKIQHISLLCLCSSTFSSVTQTTKGKETWFSLIQLTPKRAASYANRLWYWIIKSAIQIHSYLENNNIKKHFTAQVKKAHIICLSCVQSVQLHSSTRFKQN